MLPVCGSNLEYQQQKASCSVENSAQRFRQRARSSLGFADTYRRASIYCLTTCLGGSGFPWSRDRFVAQLSLGPEPIFAIFAMFAAAFEVQFMSSASYLF